MNVCRTCMESSTDELVPIFSKLEDEFIANVIVNCSSISINEDDGLPAAVCQECLSSVKLIVDFTKKVRDSDRKLRQLFKSEDVGSIVDKCEQGDTDYGTGPKDGPIDVVLQSVKNELDVDEPEVLLEYDLHESGQEDFDYDDGDDSDWKGDDLDSEEEPLATKVLQKRKSIRKTGLISDPEVEDKPRRRTTRRKVVKPDDDDEEDEAKFLGEDILDEKELEIYDLIKIDQERHICCQCCLDFETRSELEDHGKKCHSKKRKTNTHKPHACKICYRRYNSKDSLQNHKKMLAELPFKNIYECKRCSARFHAPKRRRFHAHNHPKTAEALKAQQEETLRKRPPICCWKSCYQECDTQQELLEHGRKAHALNRRSIADPMKPFECPVCYKCFETRRALTRHRNRIYRPNMQCAMCGKEFMTRNSLVTHERKHMNEKPFSCEVCGKRFPTMQALKCHNLVHNEDKPFACGTCGWSFKRECNLKIHMLTHSDTLPFKCQVCDKAFKIVEDDGLPAQICGSCLNDLKQTNVFVRKVRASDKKLRKSLKGELSDVEKDDTSEEDNEDRDVDEGPPWQMIEVQLTEVKDLKLNAEDDLKEESDTVTARRSNRHTSRNAQLKVVHSDTETSESQKDKRRTRTRSNRKVADDDPSNESMSEPETVKKQLWKKQKPKSIVDSHSTESDSEQEPVNKRIRKRRPRKIETDTGKGEDSDDDNIPDEKLKDLYKTVQVEANTHVCCACLKIFTDREELVVHGQSAHTKKKYINESKTNICDVCFRRYSKPGPLEAHKQSFVGLDVVYECCRCLTRVTAQNRRQHARTHLKHQEPIKDAENQKRDQRCCAKDCTATYQAEDLLIAHGKEAHIGNKVETDDPQRRYECPVCFKRFEKREALTRHRHRMYRSTHQCAICGKEFKNRYEMLVHERNHENIKPYSCEICGKRFNSKEAVRVHMLVHSDSKPFSCTICGWRFRRKCNLNKHASKHSEDTPFQCSICQKTFKGKYHLQYHMRIHTGHKPWPCRHCDKSFADHANRKRHESSHTGIKPYKCSYCDKSFIRKRFQIEHESSHTGIKPYRCEMCNRSFSQKTALKKHLEMHPLAPENQLSLSQPSPMPAEESPMSPPPAPRPPLPYTGIHSTPGSTHHQHTVAMMAAGAASINSSVYGHPPM